jgi:hypothetical protein
VVVVIGCAATQPLTRIDLRLDSSQFCGASGARKAPE